jgi:hypothetical protein
MCSYDALRRDSTDRLTAGPLYSSVGGLESAAHVVFVNRYHFQNKLCAVKQIPLY